MFLRGRFLNLGRMILIRESKMMHPNPDPNCYGTATLKKATMFIRDIAQT